VSRRWYSRRAAGGAQQGRQDLLRLRAARSCDFPHAAHLAGTTAGRSACSARQLVASSVGRREAEDGLESVRRWAAKAARVGEATGRVGSTRSRR